MKTQTIAILSISGINNLLMPLQLKIVEVNTIQTDDQHPGVCETSLHHSASHSVDCTKKRSAKNRNYYERHKATILSKRKQRYQENAEVEKAASRVVSKVNYARNAELACAASKVNYASNPDFHM